VSDLALYPCPADTAAGYAATDGDRDCGRNFQTKNGAVMHALNTHDDFHDQHVTKKRDGYAHLEELPVGPTADQDDLDLDEPEPEQAAADGAGDVEAITPTMPAAEQDDQGEPEQDDQEMVECPNCGEPLGTRFELEQAIAEHGKVYCESCGYEVRQE